MSINLHVALLEHRVETAISPPLFGDCVAPDNEVIVNKGADIMVWAPLDLYCGHLHSSLGSTRPVLWGTSIAVWPPLDLYCGHLDSSLGSTRPVLWAPP